MALATAPEVAAAPICPRPVFAAAAVLLGSFLVGFDTRLFSIGLPDLRGAFHLSFDQGAWLNTFATAPQIVIAPAVAWLAATFGVRRVFFWPCVVYAAVSLVLPEVRDWEALVALHVVRGLLLGVFIPATLMIILRNLPPAWWVAAIGVYTFRQAFSQNAGVFLVGLYDHSIGWQWLYWQDVVIAPLIWLLVHLGTPRETIDTGLLEKADWGGMALLGTGWALVYVALDQGNRLDWFQSGLITTLFAAGATLILGFFINEMVVRAPWARHTVIMSRNVGVSFLIILCFITTSLSNAMLVPNFLTAVAGLRPEQIGWGLFLGTGLPLALVMPLAVVMVRRFDARLSMLIGFVAFAIAGMMGTQVTHVWSTQTFVPMGLVQAVGQGFTFLAAVIYILANSDPRRATASAAYVQVLRLGGAETASTLMATWVRHREQLHSYLLGLNMPADSPAVGKAVALFAGPYDAAGSSAHAANARGLLGLAGRVSREANVLAYIDAFQLTFWVALVGIALIAVLGPAPPGPLVPKA